MRRILILAAALMLTACSSFKLGSMMYCASATACDMKADPFRPADPVPVATAGAASGNAVPLVK